MSIFGGPHDLGMNPHEDLALLSKLDLENPNYADLFLAASPAGTTGLGRRLEQVGSESDALAPAQAESSAALIRWLLEQYDIPRTNVFGHDFTPGYNRPGGTSCPDKLFGAAHSQATIAAWLEANI